MHGTSILKVDNSAIQNAIAHNADKERVSFLKQQVAWSAVYGFEYHEVSFMQLKELLRHDYGFTPFKYKSVEEGAIYDKVKHPYAWGRVRGRENVNNQITWLCLDIDDTIIEAQEMHNILSEINHHIALTSNRNNKCKYRIIVELSKPVVVSEKEWKPFLKSVAGYLGIPKLDMLGRSQVFYGYDDRTVWSVIDKQRINPDRHLEFAKMKVIEMEAQFEAQIPKHQRKGALERKYSTFGFAYDAEDGEGTTMLMGAINKAKALGADRQYIIELVNDINNFWDCPMPKHRLESTVMTAI